MSLGLQLFYQLSNLSTKLSDLKYQIGVTDSLWCALDEVEHDIDRAIDTLVDSGGLGGADDRVEEVRT